MFVLCVCNVPLSFHYPTVLSGKCLAQVLVVGCLQIHAERCRSDDEVLRVDDAPWQRLLQIQLVYEQNCPLARSATVHETPYYEFLLTVILNIGSEGRAVVNPALHVANVVNVGVHSGMVYVLWLTGLRGNEFRLII